MHANSFNSRVILGSANTVELPQHLKLNPDTVEILKTNFGVSVAMAGLCDNTHALESGDTPTLADTGTSNIPTQNGFEIPHNSPSAQPEDCVVPDELFYLSKTGPSDKDTSDHWSGSAPASDTPSEKVLKFESFRQLPEIILPIPPQISLGSGLFRGCHEWCSGIQYPRADQQTRPHANLASPRVPPSPNPLAARKSAGPYIPTASLPSQTPPRRNHHSFSRRCRCHPPASNHVK